MEGKYVYLLEQENDNVKITYIDNPIILKLDTTTTTNSINVKVKAYNLKDEEYVYYIKKETSDEDFKKEKTSNSSEYTYENLQQNMGYLVKVVVKTKPNKETELTKRVVLGGVTDGTEEGAINFGATTWNETTHKASVNITTKTSYKIQYQINPTTENLTDNTKWIQIASGNSVPNLSLNDKVYARLWDGNNGGSPATFILTEDIAPKAEITLTAVTEVTGETITATVTQSDDQSGITNFANCKWVYNTTSGKIGTDATKYTGTFSQSPEELKLTATTAGTYYLHVLTIDAAGNKKETISKAITISTAPNATAVLKAGDYVQYTPTSKSFSMTTAQTGHSTAQSFATGDYTGLWQVLYNDSTNGLQLISADSVGYLYIKGATGYNKILTTLNTFCKNYENSTFTITDSGRTVGSNPTSSSTDTTTNESLVFNTSTGLKAADTRYTTDYEAMKKATSQNASGIQNIGGYYWLPSRKVFKTSDVGYFSIYTVANGGEVEYRRMKDMYVTGSNYEFEYAYGVRPVVKIKDGIKAIRGNGSSSNPYQIRQ